MHTISPLFHLLVRTVMHLAAFGSEPVLHPLLLNMDQGPLFFTVSEVLKLGKRQQVSLGVDGHAS